MESLDQYGALLTECLQGRSLEASHSTHSLWIDIDQVNISLKQLLNIFYVLNRFPSGQGKTPGILLLKEISVNWIR